MKYIKTYENIFRKKVFNVGDWVILDLNTIEDRNNEYKTDLSRVFEIIRLENLGSKLYWIEGLDGRKSHISKSMIIRKLKSEEVEQYIIQYELEKDAKKYNL